MASSRVGRLPMLAASAALLCSYANIPLQAAEAPQTPPAVVNLAAPQLTITPLKTLNDLIDKNPRHEINFQFSDDGSTFALIEGRGLGKQVVVLNGADGPMMDHVRFADPLIANILPDNRVGFDHSKSSADGRLVLSPDGQTLIYVASKNAEIVVEYVIVQSGGKIDSYPLGPKVLDAWCYIGASADLRKIVLYRPKDRRFRIGNQEFALPPIPENDPNYLKTVGSPPLIYLDETGEHFATQYAEPDAKVQDEVAIMVDGRIFHYTTTDSRESLPTLVFRAGPAQFAMKAVQLVPQPQRVTDIEVIATEKGLVPQQYKLEEFAISADGQHLAMNCLTNGVHELVLDGKVVATYPSIGKIAFAGDGTLACIAGGNGKQALWVDGKKSPLTSERLNDLLMGAHAEDTFLFSAKAVTIRGTRYPQPMPVELIRHLTPDGHLIIAGEGTAVMNPDEPKAKQVTDAAAKIWIDGSMTLVSGVETVSRPIWIAPDHFSLIAKERLTHHLFKVDVKLSPTPAVSNQSLDLSGKPWVKPTAKPRPRTNTISS